MANDVIELNKLCTSVLRKDQIAYIFAHTGVQELPGGETRVAMAVTGKKLTKVQPEGFYSIVLCTRVDNKSTGNNRHLFQTRANKSSAKSPIGMFNVFEIPNSLKLVDDTVRKFYNM